LNAISQNAGQNCVGIERLIVHSSQYDELNDIITRRAKELRFGPVMAPSVEGFTSAFDCGSMISTQRFRELENIIENADQEGGVCETGGSHYVHPYFGSGAYFNATVVGNPPPNSAIAQKEREFFRIHLSYFV
jgi:acyl-CoA reductase-like NAD-dependent aldehyde dehydrogenase